MGEDIYLRLRWLSHGNDMFAKFYSFLATKTLTDVTLAVEDGKRIFEAHKLVLASASPLLKERLLVFPHKHIVIFFNDISGDEMEALLELIYLGNISISQNNHESFLKAIKLLQIRGIVESDPSESLPAVLMGKPFPEVNPNPERCISAAYSPSQIDREKLVTNSPAPPVLSPVVAASSRLRRIPTPVPSSKLGFKSRKRRNSSSSNRSRFRSENGSESYSQKKSSRKAAKDSFTAIRTPVGQSGGSESAVRKRSRQHSTIPPVLSAEQEKIDGKSAEKGAVQITVLKCGECDKIFCKEEEFYQHVKARHTFYVGYEESMMKKVTAYNCKFCDAIFQTRRHLPFHMSKTHNHTGTTATTPRSKRRNSVQEARDQEELSASPQCRRVSEPPASKYSRGARGRWTSAVGEAKESCARTNPEESTLKAQLADSKRGFSAVTCEVFRNGFALRSHALKEHDKEFYKAVTSVQKTVVDLSQMQSKDHVEVEENLMDGVQEELNLENDHLNIETESQAALQGSFSLEDVRKATEIDEVPEQAPVLTNNDPKLRMTAEVRMKKLRPERFQEEKEVDTEDESGWETECDTGGLNCFVCGAIFHAKRELCDHYLMLHPEIDIKKALGEKRGFRHDCRFCHTSYAYFKCLQRHLQTNHPADGQLATQTLKPHPCDVCGKGYVFKWQMQRHKTMKH